MEGLLLESGNVPLKPPAATHSWRSSFRGAIVDVKINARKEPEAFGVKQFTARRREAERHMVGRPPRLRHVLSRIQARDYYAPAQERGIKLDADSIPHLRFL